MQYHDARIKDINIDIDQCLSSKNVTEDREMKCDAMTILQQSDGMEVLLSNASKMMASCRETEKDGDVTTYFRFPDGSSLTIYNFDEIELKTDEYQLRKGNHANSRETETASEF